MYFKYLVCHFLSFRRGGLGWFGGSLVFQNCNFVSGGHFGVAFFSELRNFGGFSEFFSPGLSHTLRKTGKDWHNVTGLGRAVQVTPTRICRAHPTPITSFTSPHRIGAPRFPHLSTPTLSKLQLAFKTLWILKKNKTNAWDQKIRLFSNAFNPSLIQIFYYCRCFWDLFSYSAVLNKAFATNLVFYFEIFK